MKKLLVLAILVTTIAIAQQKENKLFKTMSIGFDIRNCIVGSAPTKNKPELDFVLGLGFIKNKLEFNFGFESFKAIDFSKGTFSVGRQIKIKENLIFIPALEYTNIQRSNKWGNSLLEKDSGYFSSIALNLSFRYYLNDSVGLEYMVNILPRTDLLYQYNKLQIVNSGYLKFIYLIKVEDKHRQTRQE